MITIDDYNKLSNLLLLKYKALFLILPKPSSAISYFHVYINKYKQKMSLRKFFFKHYK